MVEVVEPEWIGVIHPRWGDTIMNGVVHDHIGVHICQVERKVFDVDGGSSDHDKGLVGMINIPTLDGFLVGLGLS